MWLDKLESGLLVLETERGRVYVQPARWQRIHLLWTFRHFKSLPVKLLSSRQARLVQALYYTTPLSLPAAPDKEFVIGTVEEAKFPAVSRTPAAILKIRAEGAKPVLAPRENNKKKRPAIEKASSSKQEAPWIGRIGWSKVGLTLAAGVVGFVLAVSAWQQIQASSNSQAAGEQEIKPTTPSSQSVLEQPALKTVTTAELQPAFPLAASPNPGSVGVQPASITEVVAPPPKPSVSEVPQSTGTTVNQVAKFTPVSKPADTVKPDDRSVANVAEPQIQEQTPRIQSSRPPRKVVYPQYPPTKAQGKVTLKAVLSSEGAVREVKVLSGNQTLAVAATRAVRQWQYSPYYKDGLPVETETSINFVFISADAISVSFPPADSVSR
jgi:TonB family protein